MLTSQQFDRIRNSVTVSAYVILDNNGNRAAQVKVVRPCRLRTGLESYTCLLETYGNAYAAVIGKAGGAGYDKVAAAQASAIRAAGFEPRKADNGRYYAPAAIAAGLGLAEGWRTVEIY